MYISSQWRIQGGDPGVRTPPSASTSLIIHYSQSTYDSLHDAAQIAPAPSEKTITGAASSRYALEVDRTSEQSVHRWRNPVGGTDEHARTKWAGQLETRGYFSRVRSLCAQYGCVNHRIFNGRPSLRVPPGSFDAKYHVCVYYTILANHVILFCWTLCSYLQEIKKNCRTLTLPIMYTQNYDCSCTRMRTRVGTLA